MPRIRDLTTTLTALTGTEWFPLDQAAGATGRITTANTRAFFWSTAVLDQVGAVASNAFSLRRVSSSYTGSAIRVRRSNDNAEQNIGFTANGDLDETALTTFTGANSGFVTTWYDQSGNARDHTQTTVANQPRIVNTGVVDKKNGRPCLVFDGTNDSVAGATSLTTTAGVFNAVFTMDTAAQADARLLSVSSSVGGTDFASAAHGFVGRAGSSGLVRAFRNANLSQNSFVPGQVHVLTSHWDGANNMMRIDQWWWDPEPSTSSFGSTYMRVGAATNDAVHVNGTISEAIVWNSTLTTGQLASLEDSQRDYYSTVDALSNDLLAVNPVAITSYTIVAADVGKVLECTNASAITITIPANVLPVGCVINIRQTGAGQVTVAAGAGTTLRNPLATAKTRAQWSELSIHHRAPNDFVLAGDASAT